jgi:hypothetical protein
LEAWGVLHAQHHGDATGDLIAPHCSRHRHLSLASKNLSMLL